MRPHGLGWWRTLLEGLVQLLYPARCWVCGEFLASAQELFCPACRQALTGDTAATCPRCASTVGPFADVSQGCLKCRHISFAFDGVFRLGRYEGQLREVVLRLKQASSEGLAEAVGALWAEHAGPRLRAAGVHVVIPVPLHWWRHWRRGYNQSEVLAQALARYLAVPCRPSWLRRIRPTPKQTSQSAQGRWANVAGAFRASRRADLKGTTVLLVDDVLTTGSTADAAARALRQAGAARILVAVLAHEA